MDWGYVDLAKWIGANLIDLNASEPYSDYASVPVGKDWFIYKKFTFNRLLEEADVFVSVAKMKCHWLCGITQSMKNLVGLVPFKFYEYTPGDGYRTGFHGADAETKTPAAEGGAGPEPGAPDPPVVDRRDPDRGRQRRSVELRICG